MSRLFSEEEIYEKFRPYVSSNDLDEIIEEMTETKVIIIPDDATNGDMIKAMFNPVRIIKYTSSVQVYFSDKYYKFFEMYWWNEPYHKGE